MTYIAAAIGGGLCSSLGAYFGLEVWQSVVLTGIAYSWGRIVVPLFD